MGTFEPHVKRGSKMDAHAKQIPIRRRGSIRRRLANDWQLYVLILPAIAYLFIFHIMPMYGVQIGFKDFRTSKGIWDSPWVGLKHFRRFVTYPNFWKLVRNTIVLSLYSLATFPLPVMLALLINEVRNNRFKKTVQMITYAPHFISVVVLCSMVTLFLNRTNGVVNHVIAALGGQRVDFLGSAKMFPSVYVWSGVWQNVGWSSILYISALSNISAEMVEAAKIDGASRLQIVTRINIPSILPTIVIMLILRCGSVLSVGFEKVYLLQNDLNLDTSQVISTYVYEVGLGSGAQFSYSSAIGLFNNLVNIAILLLVNRISKAASSISLF